MPNAYARATIVKSNHLRLDLLTTTGHYALYRDLGVVYEIPALRAASMILPSLEIKRVQYNGVRQD